MSTPQARLRIGGTDVLLLGTIAGFVPDADRVKQAFDAFLPDLLALGIPPEDLPALDALADKAAINDLPQLDDATEKLLELIGKFGATRIPSPELEAAHAAATASGIPIVSIDLDDVLHGIIFTKAVKFYHILQSNGIKGRLLKKGVQGSDAYEVADAWDKAWMAPRGLRKVEAAREIQMADRLRANAKDAQRILAIIPSTRLPGVVRRLGNVDDAAPTPAAQ